MDINPESRLDKFLVTRVKNREQSYDNKVVNRNHPGLMMSCKISEDESLPNLTGNQFSYGSFMRGAIPRTHKDIHLALILDGSNLMAYKDGKKYAYGCGSGQRGENPLLKEKYNDNQGFISSNRVIETVQDVASNLYQEASLSKNRQTVSVALDTCNFNIDIVPAVRVRPADGNEPHYFIPAKGGSHGWVPVQCEMHILDHAEENERHGQRLGLISDLVRAWNSECNENRLTPFYLDTWVPRVLSSTSVDSLHDGLEHFFRKACNQLSDAHPQAFGLKSKRNRKYQEAKSKSLVALDEAKRSVLIAGILEQSGKFNEAKEVCGRIFGYQLVKMSLEA